MARVADNVECTLNGLRLTFHGNSGSLLRMEYPGVGVLLKAESERASIIDLAYPYHTTFEPLRMASRFSTGVAITKTSDSVVLHWDSLGMSWDYTRELPGRVSATVTFRAASDGRSVLVNCVIRNDSENTISQVLFPDFWGIQPIGGEADFEFRCCGFAKKPFVDLKRPERGDAAPYYENHVSGTLQTSSGGYFPTSPMIARWFDLGSLKGGLSVFHRVWSRDWENTPPKWNSVETVWMRLHERDKTYRVACLHDVEIEKGERWESLDYVITPHRHGWAKGIEPYAHWVRQNLERPWPMPRHVREGLGCRTVWMLKQYFDNPGSVVFRAEDLPALAKEAKEHGLDEMVVWTYGGGTHILPPDSPHPSIGSREDWLNALQACKQIGVNPSLFVSIVTLYSPTAEKLGLKVDESVSWTYHPESIPMFQAKFGTLFRGAWANQDDKRWQDGVLELLRRYIADGAPSICWDQFCESGSKPNLAPLISEFRNLARAADQESTLSGESLGDIDMESRYLDYTWDWHCWPPFGFGDVRPFVNAYPAPRLNCNVDRSAVDVRYCFIDNCYVNVMPSEPESVNGSSWINNYPELSKTLKQCARLRRQFIDYFVNGRLVGDCVLRRSCAGARVNAYLLADRAMVIVMNQSRRRPVAFSYDLAPWLTPVAERYEVEIVGMDSESIEKRVANASARFETPVIGSDEFVILEFRPIR
jgi:hypothetical protein